MSSYSSKLWIKRLEVVFFSALWRQSFQLILNSHLISLVKDDCRWLWGANHGDVIFSEAASAQHDLMINLRWRLFCSNRNLLATNWNLFSLTVRQWLIPLQEWNFYVWLVLSQTGSLSCRRRDNNWCLHFLIVLPWSQFRLSHKRMSLCFLLFLLLASCVPISGANDA